MIAELADPVALTEAAAQVIVDAGGESDSVLSRTLYGAMSEIAVGQVLRVYSRSAASRSEVTRWCGLAGHEILHSERVGKDMCFLIRKTEDAGEAELHELVPFALPHIDDDDVAGVTEVLRSGWLTTGAQVAEFERRFAERIGVRHAIALNSGTAALHLALDALGLGPDDEVIVPTMTFTATAEVVRYFDAKPVLVDVDPVTLCIDPAAVEAAITPRTRAIIPVHIAGQASDMERLMAIARERGLVVIEDAAHSFPAYLQGKPAGSFGHLSAFSFYATKTITTGEGGMLLTDDDDYAERVRMMSLHGMSRDAWNRYTAAGSWRYDVVAPGFKYNLTDIAAALGLSQLQKADWLWERRISIAERYSRAFVAYPALELPNPSTGASHAWHLYILRLNLDRLTIDRDTFVDELAARGIKTSVHFIPLHEFTYYRDTYGYEESRFPVASREFRRMISLPIYPAMREGDVERVIRAVQAVTADAIRR